MELQPITYRGRTLAACTERRVFLSDALEAHPREPLTSFVLAMCLYAGAILNRHHPGPYTEQDARVFARNLLIPAELLEHPGPRDRLDLDATARALGVPADELRLELAQSAPRSARLVRRSRRRRARRNCGT